jgi:pimeloyl-ACP methyl ester carboxylesterase
MTTITTADFRTRDGILLRYTRRGSGRHAAVLVAPGIFVHRESDEHRILGERLSQVADVVTLDVRGHGDSGGAFTFGVKEPEDVAELARYLRGTYDRLGGLGFSFGGYHTAVAAARHHCFDAVALVGTPHRLAILDHNFLTPGLLRSMPLMMRRRRRLTRLSPRVREDRAVPSQLVGDIAPAPLLVVHGTDDWLIPADHARILFEHAAEPKRLLLLPGGLHAEYIVTAEPESLLAPLAAFFSEALR